MAPARDQQMILDLLHTWGTLPAALIEPLLKLDPACHTRDFDSLLAGLKREGWIILCEGQVSAADHTRPGNPYPAAALELMLELSPGGVLRYQRGNAPFVLTFFRERKNRLYRYDVCPVPAGREQAVSSRTERVSGRYRKIVFLLEKLEQEKDLKAGCECCFAVPQEGKYLFYEG